MTCHCTLCTWTKDLENRTQEELIDIINNMGFELCCARQYEKAFHLMAKKHYPQLCTGSSMAVATEIENLIEKERERQEIANKTIPVCSNCKNQGKFFACVIPGKTMGDICGDHEFADFVFEPLPICEDCQSYNKPEELDLHSCGLTHIVCERFKRKEK